MCTAAQASPVEPFPNQRRRRRGRRPHTGPVPPDVASVYAIGPASLRGAVGSPRAPLTLCKGSLGAADGLADDQVHFVPQCNERGEVLPVAQLTTVARSLPRRPAVTYLHDAH